MADMMFGPYRLERLVSRSGIGEVWQATDIVQGRLVALKLLPPGLASDPEFRARFRHESALAAQIDEPHIIPIHAFGEINGRLYVDMRLIRGTDLARLIAEHGALTPARAVHITTQIAAALDAVHATGLVHGEIRPGNLLITRNNDADAAGTPDNEYVYVPDSIVGRSLNGSGTPLNTNQAVADSLEYMAPEQLLYGHGDHRVDIYALGCVLYEAITAQKPFPGRGQAAMIHAHLNAAPPRASQFRPDIPAAMDQVIAIAMAKDPDHRYRSGGTLAAAARGALSPTFLKPPKPAEILDNQDERTDNTMAFATAPWKRQQHPSPPQIAPSSVSSNQIKLRGRVALASMVTLLLAAGIGVLSLNQDHRGPGPDLSGQTTTVSALPGLTSPPANSTTAPVDQVERTLTGHTGTVCAIATAQLDGRPVLISGSWDKTVRVWDLNTGTAIGSPFIGHTDLVLGVAATQLNGRLVVISGSKDDTVRVSDLATGAPIGKPFAGHTDTVFAVATAQLDGRPMIVSGSADKTVRVWDLTTGAPVGTPLTGHTSHVFALTTAQLNGRPVVISGSADKTVRVWDLATGAPIGKPFTGHTGYVTALATAQLNGRSVVISGSADKTVRVWDLATGTPIGKPFTGHTDVVSGLTSTQLNGRPVVISSSLDATVRVWDLATGAPIGTPHTDHAGGVWAVATTQMDKQTAVISGNADKTVRVWDLTAQTHS